MPIHSLNGFTCCAHYPKNWQCGTTCLLVDTNQGPVLIDTGIGAQDIAEPARIHRIFKLFTIMPMDPEQTIFKQVQRLGINPAAVQHVILTHMHFDHLGGLPDFPQATVHVHQREYDAFTGGIRDWREFAYLQRHLAHQPELICYTEQGEKWFDFDAIRLPFQPEMWFVPLFGHARGHCGVAIKTTESWWFHVADAAPAELGVEIPDWTSRVVLGPHLQRLRAFQAAHPEITITSSHEWLDFYG